MTLTPRLLALALYCAEQALEDRKGGKPPGVSKTGWESELIRALQLAVATSDSGTEFDCGEPQSEPGAQWSARQAAEFLGCSDRQVRNLAAAERLPAEKVDGTRWSFKENDVRAYKGDTTNGRRAS
jgi:excisionase family DNA binding protein